MKELIAMIFIVSSLVTGSFLLMTWIIVNIPRLPFGSDCYMLSQGNVTSDINYNLLKWMCGK